MTMPQRPIADSEAETSRPVLGLLIVASVTIMLWAAIIVAVRFFA